MDLNLSQLLNSAVQQNNLQQLPAQLLGRPQVIAAVVLQSTLLDSASALATPPPMAGAGQAAPLAALPAALLSELESSATNLASGVPAALSSALETTPAGQTASLPAAITQALTNQLEQILTYRINVQWQGKVLQLLSPTPLPSGAQVKLQISARGEVSLVQDPVLRTGVDAGAAADTAGATVRTGSANATNTVSPSPPATPRLPAALAPLEQALRETLPREGPLNSIVPLLEKLTSPELLKALPTPIVKAIAQLLRSVPEPAQLQDSEGLKQALTNSGSALESRLLRSAQPTPAGVDPDLPKESTREVVQTDFKAQILQLFTLIKRSGLAAPEPARNQNAGDTDDLVYTRPTNHAPQAGAAPAPRAQTVDVLLAQLSKVLDAGLARIQLNQLDSASTRHPSNTEALNPTPAWVFELPVQTARGTDNLSLRIEQRLQTRGARKRMQWTVQLAFDLHELGKLAATLTILDHNVAATLWSEREHTHRTVQAEIDNLKQGLEAVGVKVTEVQCRLGLPPARASLLGQQLVDVHT